jgi:hypothetical protein
MILGLTKPIKAVMLIDRGITVMEFIMFLIKYRLIESVIITFCVLAVASVFLGIIISPQSNQIEDEDEER